MMQRGRTALHLACQLKNVRLAVLLLQLGCKLNIADQVTEFTLTRQSIYNLIIETIMFHLFIY